MSLTDVVGKWAALFDVERRLDGRLNLSQKRVASHLVPPPAKHSYRNSDLQHSHRRYKPMVGYISLPASRKVTPAIGRWGILSLIMPIRLSTMKPIHLVCQAGDSARPC